MMYNCPRNKLIYTGKGACQLICASTNESDYVWTDQEIPNR